MFVYKMLMATIIGTLVITNTVASVKDWTGDYNILGINNQIINIKHTPTSVDLNHMGTGPCAMFSKGSHFNGIVLNTDVSLCVEVNVETFDEEVSKIGPILNRKITLDPTYTNN